jgi:hypothetical protein
MMEVVRREIIGKQMGFNTYTVIRGKQKGRRKTGNAHKKYIRMPKIIAQM